MTAHHTPPPDDTTLWERIRTGDRDAFADIFDRHAGAVYGHLLRRSGDSTEAEDLTSAVFLTAWRRRADITIDRGSALPWLLGTANHTLNNSRRALRRHRALIAKIAPPPDEHDHADDVADRIDEQAKAAELRRTVASLPRLEREVVELCSFAGLDQQAAAVALGTSPATVKSRLHRARGRLRTHLTPPTETLTSVETS
jgi:RNA polymerase sigma-70 factor (ECF subfamily)